MANKRSLDRVALNAKVEIRDRSGRMICATARLGNISKKGFAVMAEEKLIRGSIYQFRIFLLFGGTIDLEGKVVHLKMQSIYSLGGVAIESISFTQKGRLNRFLASKSPSYQKRFVLYSLACGAGVWILLRIVGAPEPKPVIAALIAMVAAFVLLPF